MAQRWTAKRKAVVVDQVLNKGVSREELIALHGLSEEELDHWVSASSHGIKGLRINARRKRFASAPLAPQLSVSIPAG